MKTLERTTAISFKNILFLTDFTPASDVAFTYAVALARHFVARLYPAHAVIPYVPTELEAPVMPDILNQIESDKRAQLLELVKRTGVSNSVLVTRQDIEVAVPHWINEHGIDLIVMGTHGRKGVERLFLGSTAEAIVRAVNAHEELLRALIELRMEAAHYVFTHKGINFLNEKLAQADQAIAKAEGK